GPGDGGSVRQGAGAEDGRFDSVPRPVHDRQGPGAGPDRRAEGKDGPGPPDDGATADAVRPGLLLRAGARPEHVPGPGGSGEHVLRPAAVPADRDDDPRVPDADLRPRGGTDLPRLADRGNTGRGPEDVRAGPGEGARRVEGNEGPRPGEAGSRA